MATRDLKHGDFGMTLHEKLFISLVSVFEDATLGPIYTSNMDLFADEYLKLSVFLAYHMQLQNKSFYFPYLSLLPEPETIENWTDDELSVLQIVYDDDSLCLSHETAQCMSLCDHVDRDILMFVVGRSFKMSMTANTICFHANHNI